MERRQKTSERKKKKVVHLAFLENVCFGYMHRIKKKIKWLSYYVLKRWRGKERGQRKQERQREEDSKTRKETLKAQ